MKQKKKIAILSMQRVVNFGSVLQAYSLREMVQEITDASVTFLDIEEADVLPSRKSVSESTDYDAPAAYPKGILQKAKRWLIAQLSKQNKRLIRKFMQEELNLDESVGPEHFDCVIVGSDEVFNHRRGVCLQLHGNVQQAEKVISYAAACGSASAADIYPGDMKKVREAMSHFSAMSVRDPATQAYVSNLWDGPILHHLDPVLVGRLSEREPRPVPLKNYLLVYAYGQRIRTAEEIDAIRSFAQKHHLRTVAVGGSQFWCDLYIPVIPFRLMDYFYHADYVVTDTFHGTIFSVINRKKFAVLPRKTNVNKLTGLLQDLHLESRKAASIADLEQVLTENIDYTAVDSILASKRGETMEYLRNQLEG